MKKIIVTILVLLLTGCWDQREIRDLGISSSFLFDYKDGKVIFMAELVNPATQSSVSTAPAGEIPYLYIRGEGKEILDATNNSTLTINKYLYVSHIKAIFITEAFAKEVGLVPLMDLFSRYPELRQNELMVVVQGDNPGGLYKSSTSLSDYFGDFVEDSAKAQAYRLSRSTYTKMLDVIKSYYCSMENPVLGVIHKEPVNKDEIDKKNPLTGEITNDNTKVLYEGLAVFDKDKLKYIANGEETFMYNLIMGKARAINVETKETTFKITDDRPQINLEYKKNKLKIDIKLAITLMGVLDKGKHDYDDIKTIRKLEKEVNEKLSKDVKKFLDTAQTKIGVDFFKFATSFHTKYPKEWQKINKKWDKYFKDADITVKVESKIKSEGKTRKSVKEEA